MRVCLCVCLCGQIAFENGLLAQNGTVAVDNAYRSGNNYLPSDQPPEAARLFGEHVANDSSLHKVRYFGVHYSTEFRICVRVEVAILGCPS